MHEFFTSKGRLNRRPFFFRGLALSLPSYLFFQLPEAWELSVGGVIEILFLAIAFAALVLNVIQTIKRLHDVDKSGWYILLSPVPFINLILGLYLLFKKGTEGPNRFGDDPLLKYAPPAAPSQSYGRC